MANKDNGIKASHGKEAKDRTRNALKKCESVDAINEGIDHSNNSIEKASSDLEVKIKNHSIPIYITSTWSLRKDRMDATNTALRRLKNKTADKKAIAILSSPFMEENPVGNNHVLTSAYNFGDREDIGVDVVVKTEDLADAIDIINAVEDKDNIAEMLRVVKDFMKKKNY